MSKSMIGLDIGTQSVKLALMNGDRIHRLVSAPMPDNLLRDGRLVSPETMADELRSVLRQGRISARSCALVLPSDVSFTRRLTVPRMTVEQLRLNLPYEFHDYIQKDKDLYFYDYAVVGEQKDEKALELLASAVPKEVIAEARTMLRRAGLHLELAIPECLTYRNLIRAFERRGGEHPGEYCMVDMGHHAIRMHMYRGDVYETSRVIEYGGASLDALIADAAAVDPHVAADYKRSNYEGAQEIPACRDLYSRIAVEILRAVNFYGFNTPGSDLQDLYFGGGLAKVSALRDAIRDSLGQLRCHGVEELLPPTDDRESAPLCAAAVGVTLQSNGR